MWVSYHGLHRMSSTIAAGIVRFARICQRRRIMALHKRRDDIGEMHVQLRCEELAGFEGCVGEDHAGGFTAEVVIAAIGFHWSAPCSRLNSQLHALHKLKQDDRSLSSVLRTKATQSSIRNRLWLVRFPFRRIRQFDIEYPWVHRRLQG